MTTTPEPQVSATAWQDGYVVDVAYIEPITIDLSPAWFSMACVLNGQPPLDTSRPLVWAELGSGSGLSACMVAAANDGVEVWGCDFNPAHVERSRALAAAAALENCSFDEASFEEVATNDDLGPPEVDVVVVHGVYSWISPANQRHVVEFVRRRLRPGGIAYLSYEVPTGWASMVPISEALRLHTEADGRRSDIAFPDAVAAIQTLAEGGARCFPLGPHEQYQLTSLPTADVRYAVHEYLGAHFGPLMFDQVANAMASSRCSHLGSLDPVDHLHDFWVPPGLADLVGSTRDVTLREMLRDLATQRPLRRDVFRRGMATSPIPQRERWLNELTVVGLDKELKEGATVGVPVGEATLTFEFYSPLVSALQEGPLSVAAAREIGRLSLADATAAVCFLVAGGYAAPVVRDPDNQASREGARRLNRVLIEENARGGDHRCLIAPVTGAALTSEYVEMLSLGLLWDGAPADPLALAPRVLEILATQGRQLREEGQIVEAADQARTIAEARIVGTLERRPVYDRLGIT